jgi:hypothetical protein
VILEAALRLLFSAPEHEVWVELEARDEREALAHARRAAQLPLRYLSLSVLHLDARGPWRVAAHLAGKREPVAWELAELLPALPGARALEGAAAAQRAGTERDARLAGSADRSCTSPAVRRGSKARSGSRSPWLARGGADVRLSAEPRRPSSTSRSRPSAPARSRARCGPSSSRSARPCSCATRRPTRSASTRWARTRPGSR